MSHNDPPEPRAAAESMQQYEQIYPAPKAHIAALKQPAQLADEVPDETLEALSLGEPLPEDTEPQKTHEIQGKVTPAAGCICNPIPQGKQA